MIEQKQFLTELKKLLAKYDAEITCEDHWSGYAECGEDVRITIEFTDYKIKDIELGKNVSPGTLAEYIQNELK